MYKLVDIRDWIDFFDGKLKIKRVKFDVTKTFQSIMDIMNFRAGLMNVQLEFEAIFSLFDDQGDYGQDDLLE